jgi:hypothetical protein
MILNYSLKALKQLQGSELLHDTYEERNLINANIARIKNISLRKMKKRITPIIVIIMFPIIISLLS